MSTTFDESNRNVEKIKTIRNSRTNHKSDSILNLKNKIEKLDNYIKSKHDITSFIWFKVNDFELDTRDVDSFMHYAVSMENQKTGVGQGNQFKLRIAYNKQFSHYYEDVNRLELALTQLRNASLYNYPNNLIDNVRNLNYNVCYLQYGYLENDEQLKSPMYQGMLLKYSVTANKQIIEYTLEGFTGEQVAVNTVNWYPNIEGYSKDKLNNVNVLVGKVTTKDSQNKISEAELKDIINKLNSEYSGGMTYQPFLALDNFLYDYNSSTDDKSTKFYLLDCTDESEPRLWENNTLEPVHMSLCVGQTPIQYIEYCISLFKYKKTRYYAIEGLNKLQATTPRFIYNIVTDPEDSNKKYVCVDAINETNNEDKVAYEFIGYSTENSLLIDYNLNYDGTVALAVANNYNSEYETNQNAIYIDSDGSLRAQTSMTRDMFVSGEISEVLISKQNSWLDNISCANNCTMTTFGLPFEISTGTIFKCGIYITDTLHHTSGNCFVTSITDRIENSKFISYFNMIRLPGKNTELDDITSSLVAQQEEQNSNINKTKTTDLNTNASTGSRRDYWLNKYGNKNWLESGGNNNKNWLENK